MLAAKGEHRSPHDHQTTTASSLAPGITPHGNLVLFASDDTPALEPAVAKRLLDGFARGAGHGLLQLGASEVGTPLPATLSYWRELGARFVTALCARPGGENIPRGAEVPTLPSVELEAYAEAAPPMSGAEYVSVAVLERLWGALDRACRTELAEYAGTANKPRLLSLLLPVQRAAEKCSWLRLMVDAGEIFHPLRWTPAEALRLLQDIPALEASGVIVRVPASWRANRPPRPQVTATVGGKAPAGLGKDA